VTDLSVGDHVHPTETHDSPGTYRVVGVDERRVTLLRVADGDGRRVHTGETIRVERTALDAFEATEPPVAGGWGVTTAAYWSVRAFSRELAASPLSTGVGVALVLGGLAAPVPAPADGGLVAAGSLLLALVGSGRLRS
jgi:hypothetical protein